MNPEKIKSIGRHILSFIGGILLAFGLLDEQIVEILTTNLEVILGGVVAIIAAFQGARNKDKIATT